MSWYDFILKRKKTRLQRFKEVEPLIHELFSPVNKYLGMGYFKNLAPMLCEITGADRIIIGHYNHESHLAIALVNSSATTTEPLYTYNLKDTPCESTRGQSTCCYAKNAYKNFPGDPRLIEGKMEGLIGIPLYNTDEEPNGILIALFKKPIGSSLKTIEDLLQIFAPRISTEIEHLLTKQALKLKNETVNHMHDELRKKNEELDVSIAALNKAKIKADENDQLKTAFLANLSHEIRTPMNSILGFSEILRSDALDAEERDEYIDIINVNGHQLLKVMDNLIDISKLQTSLIQEGPKQINLNTLLEKMSQHYLNEITLLHKPINIFLEKGLKEPDDMIITSSDGLVKVLNHLLDNALKFTSRGWVKFGYSSTDHYLEFFVKDTGIGLPQGSESVIFEMFRQVQQTNDRQFGGNGLGLAICKKYIESMGGDIWYDKNDDLGTCFRFTIPYAQQKQAKKNVYNQLNPTT